MRIKKNNVLIAMTLMLVFVVSTLFVLNDTDNNADEESATVIAERDDSEEPVFEDVEVSDGKTIVATGQPDGGTIVAADQPDAEQLHAQQDVDQYPEPVINGSNFSPNEASDSTSGDRSDYDFDSAGKDDVDWSNADSDIVGSDDVADVYDSVDRNEIASAEHLNSIADNESVANSEKQGSIATENERDDAPVEIIEEAGEQEITMQEQAASVVS